MGYNYEILKVGTVPMLSDKKLSVSESKGNIYGFRALLLSKYVVET